jgi:hypothetical protein
MMSLFPFRNTYISFLAHFFLEREGSGARQVTNWDTPDAAIFVGEKAQLDKIIRKWLPFNSFLIN